MGVYGFAVGLAAVVEGAEFQGDESLNVSALGVDLDDS